MHVVALERGLFSTQGHRWALNEASGWISWDLRNGDLDTAARNLRERAAGLGIDDAVLGQRGLYRVPFSTTFTREPRRDVVILGGGRATMPGTDHLVADLERRGASVEVLRGEDVRIYGGEMYVDGHRRRLPEAVVPSPMAHPYRKTLVDILERLDVHVVNGVHALSVGRDKNLQGDVFGRAGLAAPRSVGHIKTMRELARAGAAIGYPAVAKNPLLAMGEGVQLINDADELRRFAVKHGMRTNGQPSMVPLKLEEYLELGKRDVRFEAARDAETGVMRPVSATERVANGDDIRANSLENGNMIRPILDLSGGDPALPAEKIELGLRAAEAGQFDSASVDLGTTVEGRHVLIEIDNWAHPTQLNHPVPLEQQIMRRVADIAVYGDRDRWRAATRMGPGGG